MSRPHQPPPWHQRSIVVIVMFRSLLDPALLIDGTFSIVEKISSVSVQTSPSFAGDAATSVASTLYGMAIHSSTASRNGNQLTTKNSGQGGPSPFAPVTCSNASNMGAYCNISAAPCNIVQPCQNNGTCNNTNTTPPGYVCLCSSDTNGTLCELDYRPCQLHTCWNNGRGEFSV